MARGHESNDVKGSKPRETRTARRERLAERVRTLPQEPGCYIMRGADGVIFYVGKASNLRARVRSYFSGSDTRQFVQWLDDLLFDLEFVVVRNEKEALLLERTLVKEHQPRFNVKLRDDKNFIHLKLETRPPAGEAALRRRFPRVEVVRGPVSDGARLFGPFHSATGVRQTLRVLNRYFQLRTCRDNVLENRVRPCLQHQIGRCPAPCVLAVPDYAERVAEAALFLGGKSGELEARLKERMRAAADALEFETAARVRDQLAAVHGAMDDQVVTEVEGRRDIDVIAARRSGAVLLIVRVVVRDGRMQGTEQHTFANSEFPTGELVVSFLSQLYGGMDAALLPDEILTNAVADVAVGTSPTAGEATALDDPAAPPALSDEAGAPESALALASDFEHAMVALEDMLAERAGRRVQVRVPKRGHGKRLLEIAAMNADAAMADALRKREVKERGLAALQERLGMTRPPRTIECFDISLFQGTDAVASQVCFVDGAPHKAGYRRYTIKTVSGTDDFAMLHETLVRRLKRGLRDQDLPDLLVVDGGKGQLNVALAACKDTGVMVGPEGIYLASIAKARSFAEARPQTPRDERLKETASDALQMSPERLFVPYTKDPLVLRPHTAERFLLEQLRDEAHRFAITTHRARRARRTLRSIVDEIPGIGPKKRTALLTALGSAEAIVRASVDDIARVDGIGPTLAVRIHAFLRGEDGQADLSGAEGDNAADREATAEGSAGAATVVDGADDAGEDVLAGVLDADDDVT